MGHLAKECPGIGPICICCKIVGHEVEDCPRMIAKVETMNMRQEKKVKRQRTYYRIIKKKNLRKLTLCYHS
jgi:hypothetical protein